MQVSGEIERMTHSPVRRLDEASGLVHILFVIDQLKRPFGGGERVLLETIARLPPDRFRCSILTFRSDLTPAEIGSLPCRLHLFPMTSSFDLNALRMAVKLVRLIRSEDVRIVHTFFETSDLWAGTIVRLASRAFLVSSRRDMGILRSAKHRVAYRLLGPLAHKVLTVSNQVRQYVISTDRMSRDKVATIYNGIETAPRPNDAAIAALRERLAIPVPGGRLITAVGNVRKVKGFDVLIRAASRICAQNPQVTFIVVGDVSEPEHYQELLRMVRDSGLSEKFRFIGPESDVFPFLFASDIFVLPSRSEGFSNALLEAMAAGLPCIATRVGGNPEAVHDGKTGILVVPEDADMLADGICRLLQNPQQAEQMGCAGRELLNRQFSLERMMRSLIAVYENLLDQAPAERKRPFWASGTQA